MNDKATQFTTEEKDILRAALLMYVKSTERAMRAAQDGQRLQFANAIQNDLKKIRELVIKV